MFFTDAVVEAEGFDPVLMAMDDANRFGGWWLPPSVSRSDRVGAPASSSTAAPAGFRLKTVLYAYLARVGHVPDRPG